MEGKNSDIQTETTVVNKQNNQGNKNYRGRGGNFKKVKRYFYNF